MTDELEGYAEQTEGFALALEMICEEFGLTCSPPEEEGSRDCGERSETEQGEAEGA